MMTLSDVIYRNLLLSRWQKLLTASAVALIALLVTVHPAHADGRGSLGDLFFKRLKVIGLTDDGQLVRFRAGFPHKTRNIGFISGLKSPDTALVGIDFRVQNGLLYGVGNGGGIYTINTKNAKAKRVSSLSVPLSGTFFGVDFNPAANRLRIISDNGQNLRHNLDDGPTAGTTVSDGLLNYATPCIPPPAVGASGVTGAAYTNNDLNQPSTATTLFDVDAMMDQVVIQSPPNNGCLMATGKLGVDADPSAVGFDIYSRLKGSVTVENRAFASLLVGGAYGFYHIDLLTGKARFLGNFDEPVVDIAIPLNQ